MQTGCTKGVQHLSWTWRDGRICIGVLQGKKEQAGGAGTQVSVVRGMEERAESCAGQAK